MPGQNPQALHKRLIQQACETDKWRNGTHRNGWKATLRTVLNDPRWLGDRDDVLEFLKDMAVHPDAWRIWVDEENDLLYLEFLEVEVSHHISEDKKEHYEWFWWALDGTMSVRLQIWRMDRFGIISEFMTGNTIHQLTHFV